MVRTTVSSQLPFDNCERMAISITKLIGKSSPIQYPARTDLLTAFYDSALETLLPGN